MRPISIAFRLGLVVFPLLAVAAPGRAENQGGLLDQAQRFLNGNGAGSSDRDQQAYERGREDERRAQANRDVRRDDRDTRYSESDRVQRQGGNLPDPDNRADSGYRSDNRADSGYRNGPASAYQR
jgi:hypothetical protein